MPPAAPKPGGASSFIARGLASSLGYLGSGRTSNDDDFAFDALSINEELVVCDGSRHVDGVNGSRLVQHRPFMHRSDVGLGQALSDRHVKSTSCDPN